MKLAIGLILLLLGSVTATAGYALNSIMFRVGPIPVFGGVFIAFVGLILAVSAL